MKRIREKVMVLLVLAIMFGLIGCGKSTEPKVEATNDDQISTEAETETEVEVEAEIEVEDEVVATPTVEIIPEEPIIIVEQEQQDLAQPIWQYVAGGQFIDTTTTDIFAIEDEKSGAIVVYQDGRKEIDENSFSELRDNLKEGDVVFVGDNEAFAFNEDGVTRFDETGTPEVLYYDNTSNSHSKSHSKIMWDQENGYCVVSDGLRIKYHYDKETKDWKELEIYVMVGTTQQRFDYNLKALAFEDTIEMDGTIYSNPLNLNLDEVNKYLETHNDEGITSFEIVKDSNGEPAFVVSSKGEDGLNNDDWLLAFERLNEISPDMIRYLVDQCGLRFFTKNAGTPEIIEYVTVDGCSLLGGIVITEDPNSPYGATQIILTLLYTGRIIYFNDHLIDTDGNIVVSGDYIYKTNNNFEEAFTWLREKAKDGTINKDIMTLEERQMILGEE